MAHDEQHPGTGRSLWRPIAAAVSALILVGAVALSLIRASHAAGTLRIRAGSLAMELRPCGGDSGAHPFSDPLGVQKLVMKTPRVIQPPLPGVPAELRAFLPAGAAGGITLQPFTLAAHERGSLGFESSEDGALLLGSLLVRSDPRASAPAQVQSRVVFAWRGDVRLDPPALQARSRAPGGGAALVEAAPDLRRPLQLRFETRGAGGLLRNDRLCISGLRVGREVPDGVGPPRFQSTVRGGEITLGITEAAIPLRAGDRITLGPGLIAELRELTSAAGSGSDAPQLSAVIVAESLSGLRINSQDRMPSLLASWIGAITSSAAFVGLAAATRALEGLRKLWKAVASWLERPSEKGSKA
jgi:hypothetical protein